MAFSIQYWFFFPSFLSFPGSLAREYVKISCGGVASKKSLFGSIKIFHLVGLGPSDAIGSRISERWLSVCNSLYLLRARGVLP